MTDFTGTTGNDIFDGGAGNDSFFMQQGGSDDVDGAGGNDGFYFGATLTYKDTVTGGAGGDTLALQGNYGPPVGEPRWEIPGPILFGVREIEVILLLSGSDTRFGDTAGNLYDYEVTTVDANISAAQTLVIQATDLLPGEDLRFDGSAESFGRFSVFAGRGNDTMFGGAGDDGFLFGTDGSFTGADRIQGNGGNDSVALRGDYTGANAVVLQFQSAFLERLFVENLVFLSGLSTEFGGTIVPGGFDYDVTLAEENGARHRHHRCQ
jgi:Ca2+-binding RTX toxin-like protein